MSQVTYRANLSAKAFPFLSQNWGRTIIVPQYDNTFSRQLASQEDSDKDVGIPQIYYCHNVMPHQQGFQSIGYTTLINGITEVFSYIGLVRDVSDFKAYFAVSLSGKFYTLESGIWTYKGTYGNPGALITVAYMAGTTYIYVANYGCLKFDLFLRTFSSVTLTSLDSTQVLGITYSMGYLIAWTNNQVSWSSTIDPTDFTPSLITGAGGGGVESARGGINLCFSHTQGFIVYTTSNAVAALYSGNAQYPFNYREIVGSGGLDSINQIAFDANSGNHYAYTTSGMQLISTTQTQTVLPELTDFIAGKLFEDYDEVTDTFYTLALSSTMQKQITAVSDRYLVVSYGISSLTHAVVYDLTNKRWGKLKIPHIMCFEYQISNPGVTEIPRQSIAFLQTDGTVKSVDFSITSANSNGVLCLGKYQFVRQRTLQLDEIHLENVPEGTSITLYDLAALDGKNSVKYYPELLDSNGLYRRYGSRAVGINHSLVLRGSFSLVSLVLAFSIHAKR
jgi:hypothetical protein